MTIRQESPNILRDSKEKIHSIRNTRTGAKELTQQLRALVSLAKVLSSIPSTHVLVQPPITPRDSLSSSDLHEHQAYTWCLDTHAGKTLIPMK